MIVLEFESPGGVTEAQMASWLQHVQHCLASQDNRATALPVFQVRRSRQIIVPNGHGDGPAWFKGNDPVDAELEAALERTYRKTYDVPDGNTRHEYLNVYEVVQSFLTLEAATNYLAANAHNLTKPDIYVDSGYRNTEWQNLRTLLLNCTIKQQGA